MIKYGIEPIYLRDEEKKTRLLYGYVASKCYILDRNGKFTVLFPYSVNGKVYKLNKRREKEQAIIGFNTNYIDEIYDTYEEAHEVANQKNKKLYNNKCLQERSYLRTLEHMIEDATSAMYVNKKIVYKEK